MEHSSRLGTPRHPLQSKHNSIVGQLGILDGTPYILQWLCSVTQISATIRLHLNNQKSEYNIHQVNGCRDYILASNISQPFEKRESSPGGREVDHCLSLRVFAEQRVF